MKNLKFQAWDFTFVTIILIILEIELLFFPAISLAQGGTWTTKTPMSTARLWLSGEVVGGKIYAIGGATAAGSPTLTTVEEYDPVTNTWMTKTVMPTARYNMASAVADGKIYIVGGGHSFQVGVTSGVRTLEVYDPATDTWDTTKTDMPTAREGASGCMVDDIIYVIGGVVSGGVALKTVEAYDPATDTWTTKAPMPTGRWALSTAVVDGKIYAMGTGQGGNTVEEYDPATDTWTSKASMLIGIGYFDTGVVDGIIYTLGGASGSASSYSRVFAYDPSADEWSEKTAMSTARWGLCAGVVNGKIYAIGGTSGWPVSPLSTNEEYTPTVTSMENRAIINPVSIALHQNYPNPFNPETTIEYTVKEPCKVKLIVINLAGQVVKELVNSYQQRGVYTVDVNMQEIPSGIYFYKVIMGNFQAVKKMVKTE